MKMEDFEKLKVDKEAFLEQFRADCEENGLTFKVWCPNITREEVLSKKNGELFTAPNIEMKGNGSAIAIATLILSVEEALSTLKQNDEIKLAMTMLKLFTTPGTPIDTKQFGEGN